MQTLLDHWQCRRAVRSFHATVAVSDDGLVLGSGTILLPIGRERGTWLTPGRDAGHDRLVALLAVAGGGRLPPDALHHAEMALDDWRRGDKALAAIRLAFAPLPRLDGEAEAYTLFLAETALDAGLSPRELLAELGYAEAVGPLLKGAADQPRVPAGRGRASGQWTGGSGSSARDTVDPSRSPASGSPRTAAETGASVVPVFLDTDRDRESVTAGKPPPFTPETVPRSVAEGHVLDLLIPKGAAVPLPVPSPSPDASEDKDGPACPVMGPDRGHGSSEAAQIREALIALLVNPSDPTPKQTPDNPAVQSQAYFLPQPNMKDGRVSYDDCKKTGEPSPISEMRRGDMVEVKSDEASFIFHVPTVRGYTEFRDQVTNQNDAVEREGQGRRIFYCVPTAYDASTLTEEFRYRYKASRFLVCH